MSDSSPFVDQVATLIRAKVGEEATSRENQQGQARLVAELLETRNSRRLPAWQVALACTALALLLFAGLYGGRLSYEVDWASAGASNQLGHRPMRMLAFSEGTRLRLTPGSDGHVGRMGFRGAEFVLEQGTLDADVVHRPFASWSVLAGPFTVAVKGTRFSISWSPQLQRLELALHEGAVEVRGATLAEGRQVRVGERLTVDLVTGKIQVGSAATPASPVSSNEEPSPEPVLTGLPIADEDKATASAPSQGAPAARANQAVAPAAVSAAPSPPSPLPTWSERVASGDFKGVVDDARTQGVEGVLSRATSADLSALADAARYVGDRKSSAQALASQRQRFPGTERAAMSAFLLGRLAEEQGDSRTALTWYDRYLDEQPNGTFAQEALGRKMLTLQRDKPALVVDVAQQYLQRFPAGPRAAVARQIVGKR